MKVFAAVSQQGLGHPPHQTVWANGEFKGRPPSGWLVQSFVMPHVVDRLANDV
jgi:hypothetical protein